MKHLQESEYSKVAISSLIISGFDSSFLIIPDSNLAFMTIVF
jgi:hypothetical protein